VHSPGVILATAAAAIAAVEHGHLRVEALQHDLRRIAILAVLVLPFAGLQRTFEVDLGALAQILLGDLAELLAEDHHPVPLGLFAALAGVLVAPTLRGRDVQIADRTTVLSAADLRVSPEIANEDDLVHGTGHDYPFFATLLIRRILSCAAPARCGSRAVFHTRRICPASSSAASRSVNVLESAVGSVKRW
jgi:hypothetical protein